MARPLGPPKGRTAAANTFALWLRTIIGDKTGDELAARFNYRSSAWSDYRLGKTLVSDDLLVKLVEEYIGEPGMQKEQIAKGRRLLEVAREAVRLLDARPEERAVPAGSRGGDRVDLVQALVRLDNARQLQIDAIQKLAESERTRDHFERIASALQERCDLLEAELRTVRIQAREEARTELRKELDLSVEYRRQADAKLAQARRTEEHARSLQVAATQQVTRERIVLREAEQDDACETEDALPAPVVSLTEKLGLVPLDQIPDLMRVGQERLDDQDQELAELDQRIGLSSTAGDDGQEDQGHGEPLLQGEVIRDSASAGAPAAGDEDVRTGVEDQPAPGVVRGEPPENPTTSSFGDTGIPENGDSSGEPAGTVQTASLESALADVTTWDVFAAALRHLRDRAGGEFWTAPHMAKLAYGPTYESGGSGLTIERIVEGWFEGEPMQSKTLHTLVSAMGASVAEAEAFAQARSRIISTERSREQYPTETPQHRAWAEVSGRRKATAWTTALVVPVLLGAVTAAYTAGLQAKPGIAVWQLVLYGIGALVVICLVGFVGIMVAAHMVDTGANTDAEVLPGLVLVGLGLVGCLVGFATPWFNGGDALGHWLADQVGMLPAPSRTRS